jgi:arylsulfatase A-like enzyme
MKTIFILMDSLNRHYLGLYGPSWVRTPNLERLARRGAVFENHFCGSMPCMPARREMMTGRLNFLEAPWGPIEPFDDCLPEELRKKRGTYSHLITDHYHYFRTMGEGYHDLFDSWEFLRGQENDRWRPLVKDPETPNFRGRKSRPFWVNRRWMDTERDEDYPTPQCFMRAAEFLQNNHAADNWHLHLEVFDPHEPFVCPRRYLEMYDDEWDNRYYFQWPEYAPVAEEPEAVRHIRKSYAATLTMADTWLGRFLDTMDALDAWKDTTVILTTDHGHLLGEHGYWAKNYMFDYHELIHIPMIVCTPDASRAGRRVRGLTATMDLAPTLLELHGAAPPPHVHGRSWLHLLDSDAPHHDAVLYGYHGKDIGMTDGRYTYCRQPLEGSFLYHYTAMPRRYFGQREKLAGADVGRFLKCAYDIPVYRVKVPSHRHHGAPDFNPIYDIQSDPGQTAPIRDAELEARLAVQMKELLERYDAPECQYARVGL